MAAICSTRRRGAENFIPICALWVMAWTLAVSFPPDGAAAERVAVNGIPIFPRFHDLHSTADPVTGEKVATYRVRTAYPATEVLAFYDAYFHGAGWIPSHETCQRGWTYYPKHKDTENLKAWRHVSFWKHTGRNLSAMVMLSYRKIDGKWSETVKVQCRVGKERP